LSISPSLFDSSVWLALAFDRHPHHARAGQAFAAADSLHPIAFCRSTQQSFLRLVTSPVIHQRYGSPAIANEQAWARCQQLLALPQIIWLEEPPGLTAHWHKYASLPAASPKIWMDAYLAAFACGHAISLATLDKDFTRFKGLTVRYLLA